MTEDPDNRVRMMRKRAMKFADIEDLGVPGLVYDGPKEPELVLVAYGSTSRSVMEGAEILRAEGVSVGMLRLRVLAPFPIAQLADILGPARVALFVENNFGPSWPAWCGSMAWKDGWRPEGGARFVRC